MGDLVVAREGRVDRGPALHHVGEHAVDDQVADDDAHRGAQERVDPAAVAARLHVAPALAGGGRDLEHHLPEEEDERARDVEAVREEGAVAGVRALLGLDLADREDHVVGLAGEEVAAARAAVREQADPGRVAALDLGAVGRRRARHQSSRSPSRPSGRPGCPRSSRAGCRPGWRRSARRGRSPTRRGRCVPSASQRAMVGALPSRIARRRTGSARPSISRKTMPGCVGRHALARAPRDPLDHAQRVRVVVVRADHHLRGRCSTAAATSATSSADQKESSWIAPSVIESAASRIAASTTSTSRKPSDERERQPQRRDQRRQHGVEDGDDQRDQERAPEARDRGARDDPRRHQERERRDEPGDDQAGRPDLRALGLPGERSPKPARGSRHLALLLVLLGAVRTGAVAQAAEPALAGLLELLPLRLASSPLRCSFCSATLTFASVYDCPTSSFPPVQPKTQMMRTMAKRMFQAVVISCCAVE